MKLRYRPAPSLPPLAWCAHVSETRDEVVVRHGDWVETRANGFVEGTWNGSFEALDLTTATVLCGTGGVADNRQVQFCTSSDLIDPLFSITKPGSVWISNSLVFVLAAAGEEPEPVYPFYARDVLAIQRQGMRPRRDHISLRSGVWLRLHFCAVLCVDRGCVVRIRHPDPGPRPEDYRSYQSLLTTSMEQVFANCRDPHRKFQFEPVAALSRGYDSTAAAVVASRSGCVRCVTFVDSHRDDPGFDSGRDNGRVLGLECDQYDRWRYLDMPGRPEVEFALFPRGSVPPVAALETTVRRCLLVTGYGGDIVWDRERSRYCGNLSAPWAGRAIGIGYTEFRLRVGCLILGAAFIGARHNRTLHRIANSPEMRPWSVGGAYDRPLPRRIAEEAGLVRGSFGRSKAALIHVPLERRGNMSGKSMADYRDYVRWRHAAVPRSIYHYWRCRDLLRGVLRIGTASPARHAGLLSRSRANRGYPAWEFNFLHQWAVHNLRSRYQLPGEERAASGFSIPRGASNGGRNRLTAATAHPC